ncbi:MAG TPA: ribosome maturation factor RimM, partial [Anaerovoracaceae bacterium]|nr:ribosome maturation factor RimM [Anaerovoracaceae bacterium]
LNGEMLMYIITDFPERIKAGMTVYIGKDYSKFEIDSFRNHTKGLIIKFVDIDSIEKLENLRNLDVFISTENLIKLPDGEYYHHQLLGMQVFDENDLNLGKLSEILETGANDVYVIKSADRKEELIPATKENILHVDLQEKKMVVKTLDYYNEG